ncbi:AAA family ATPase, partial [bacterium]|nr:AAA family ATPase [bacterium]
MKCPQCNHDVPDSALFCNECGFKLEVICSACQTGNPPGSKFCTKCGQKLQSAQEAVSGDYQNPSAYTPVDLVQKILSGRKHIEGERKLVTVFFADVAGFTSMSEKNDPEDIRNIMDGCFEILMKHIHHFEGTITQFLGDGLMALFGAPLAHEDHARRACLAGLATQKDLVEYGDKVKREYGIDFRMRIGLNSGLVIVGSVGDDLRMDYTAIGDTVNLASRMETAARHGTVLISKNVYGLVKAYFAFEPRGKLELKGKQEAQEAYELLHPSDVGTRIAASATRGFTRFVGRRKSMDALLQAFETASAGSGQVVGLLGDAGVGKSRLLIEFRNRLPLGEFRYLEGQCFQFGGNIIYLPVLAIVKSFFEIDDDDAETVLKSKLAEKVESLGEAFTDVIPPLQHLLSVSIDDPEFVSLEPKLKRERVFDAVRNILIRESEENPLVLAVDDLHWIDRTSEEFLDHLINSLPNSRILLLLLYRPEYTHSWGSKSCYTQIRLDQLGDDSSHELIKAILEEGAVDPALQKLIM